MNAKLILVVFSICTSIVYGQITYECPSSLLSGTCTETCTSDSDCDSDSLCCQISCGNVCTPKCSFVECTNCTYGIDTHHLSNGCRSCSCLPNPCDRFECPQSTRCEIRYVACLEEPCYPQPYCI